MDRKKRIKRLVFYFIYGFIGLFLFRLVYGYTIAPQDMNSDDFYINDFFDGSIDLKRNYASDKYESTTSGKEKGDNKSYSQQETAPMPSASEQKFEKIASMKSKTEAFEKEEKAIRE